MSVVEKPEEILRDILIAGMRDKLIHGYTSVDYGVVWRTVKDDLPDITFAIRHLLDELEKDSF